MDIGMHKWALAVVRYFHPRTFFKKDMKHEMLKFF